MVAIFSLLHNHSTLVTLSSIIRHLQANVKVACRCRFRSIMQAIETYRKCFEQCGDCFAAGQLRISVKNLVGREKTLLLAGKYPLLFLCHPNEIDARNVNPVAHVRNTGLGWGSTFLPNHDCKSIHLRHSDNERIGLVAAGAGFSRNPGMPFCCLAASPSGD